MAYKNFIPEIWAETLEREIKKNLVFGKAVNTKYEGQVKEKGDSVRILGVGKPTITETTKDGFKGLSGAEEIEDTSVTMLINQMAHYNFKVDDIDKRQAVGGLMDALMGEAAEGLVNVQDKAIAKLAADPLAMQLSKTPIQLTKDNILSQLDLAIQKLYENDVQMGTKLYATVDPAVYTVLKQAYIDKDTDNSELMANGAVAKYGGLYIQVSNNVYRENVSSHDTRFIQIKTDRAIAFARPMIHTEPYRPENSFSDAVKGFVLYGTKIVRPKELVVLNGYV